MTVLSAGRRDRGAGEPRGLRSHRWPAHSARRRFKEPGPTLVPTGIKVIDVMCPLVARRHPRHRRRVEGRHGGRAGGAGAPCLRRHRSRVDLHLRAGRRSHDLRRDDRQGDGFSDGTVGAVQTFFFRRGRWPVDSGESGHAGRRRRRHPALGGAGPASVYPCVDTADVALAAARSTPDGGARARREVAARVRQTLGAFWRREGAPGGRTPLTARPRADKLQRFFAQPFYCAEPYTPRRPGLPIGERQRRPPRPAARSSTASVTQSRPEKAFYFTAGRDAVLANAAAP